MNIPFLLAWVCKPGSTSTSSCSILQLNHLKTGDQPCTLVPPPLWMKKMMLKLWTSSHICIPSYKNMHKFSSRLMSTNVLYQDSSSKLRNISVYSQGIWFPHNSHSLVQSFIAQRSKKTHTHKRKVVILFQGYHFVWFVFKFGRKNIRIISDLLWAKHFPCLTKHITKGQCS